MVARGRGDLVVVSSAAAWQPVPHMATYAATKAFGLHLAEALAEEVRPHGVRVVAVCPGPARTEFSEVLTREGARPGPADWPWAMPSEEPAAVVSRTWAALDARRTVVATGAVARGTRLAARVVPRRVVLRAAGALHRRRGTRGEAGDRGRV
jgi:short-subunit dehydrogenase